MVRETIQSVAHDLKGSPLALALVLVNVLWLLWGGYTVREISSATARRDALMTDMMQKCVEVIEKFDQRSRN